MDLEISLHQVIEQECGTEQRKVSYLISHISILVPCSTVPSFFVVLKYKLSVFY